MHKACHFAVTPISRSEGRSAVAAAAYRLAERLWDERGDCWRDYRRKRDVVHAENVGWQGDASDLWNMAEAAEQRVNSRVAREMTISLPCELPLDDQIALARGYCLWLRDACGLASTFAIHHPYAHGLDREVMEDVLGQSRPTEHRGDPRNHHVHVLTTTRRWDPATGTLGEKVRAFDDRLEGPKTVQRCRGEWERRVNARLAQRGVAERVDLRSHAARAAAGEGPEGLVPQPKVGPAAAARARREQRRTGATTERRVLERQAAQAHNMEVWETWLMLRDLRRQQAREDGTSARIAAEREALRRTVIGTQGSTALAEATLTTSVTGAAAARSTQAFGRDAVATSVASKARMAVGASSPAPEERAAGTAAPGGGARAKVADREAVTTGMTASSTPRVDARSAAKVGAAGRAPARADHPPMAAAGATERTQAPAQPGAAASPCLPPSPQVAGAGGGVAVAASAPRSAMSGQSASEPRSPERRSSAEHDPMMDAIAWAQGKGTPPKPDAKFDAELDPETYVDPDAKPLPPPTPRAKRPRGRQRQRERVRGD